ncbi:MAG: type I-C CRISPR-associated protein Cas8c/Csd1 [Rhodobacterales bacterium]|nr:MAG: type I-C CRISPR-associated protein Cas8c/Csd1 [Rhodobacterales bacterium]
MSCHRRDKACGPVAPVDQGGDGSAKHGCVAGLVQQRRLRKLRQIPGRQRPCLGLRGLCLWRGAECASGAQGQRPIGADEVAERNRLRAALQDVATGRPADPKLDPQTRVCMLGLAPNAARLSVRFWHVGEFGDFARNMLAFWEDLRIEGRPDRPPWNGPPAAWSLLYETAIRVGGKPKAETIPPLLGGELMRAVLTGQPLPRSLLSAVVGRIRADGEVNGRRAAICKAVINRALKSRDATHFEKEMIPVSLDPDNTNPAYRLGRLFAVLESAQSAALPGLNATIKDRYFAAASATPARVFPLLIKNATHHLALLKKGGNGGLGHWLEKELGVIWSGLAPDLPRAFNLEDQGRFIAGYYHQRWTPKQDTDDTPVLEDKE